MKNFLLCLLALTISCVWVWLVLEFLVHTHINVHWGAPQ